MEDQIAYTLDPDKKRVELGIEPFVILIKSWFDMGLTPKQVAYNTEQYINEFYVKKSD